MVILQTKTPDNPDAFDFARHGNWAYAAPLANSHIEVADSQALFARNGKGESVGRNG